MLNGLLNSTTIQVLEKVAAFAERRHEVLSGNLANINTPNYRMRDLPVEKFRQALRQAVMDSAPHRPSAGGAAAASQQASINALSSREFFQVREREPNHLTFQDAGNRNIEFEVMEMTKNLLMQRYAVELMTVQMNLLQSVISERP